MHFLPYPHYICIKPYSISMKILLTLSLAFLSVLGHAQLNMTLKGQINYQQLHNTILNDIWGYVDEDGNEYALVGARDGVSIVSLADPENPVEIHWTPGLNSVWRDLKIFGDYAYITTEAQVGLLIIDLTPLPDGPIVTEVYYSGAAGFEWQAAHNLYIDEEGFCYVFGANRGNGGVIILDVATNPLSPIEVGIFDNWYVHDGYARDNLLYLGHIFDGFLSIVDITDKANPVLLGTANTPNNFTHNIWPSDDGNYAFTTDEVSGAFLGAFDVSDPANIVEVGRIQSSPGLGMIPHNVHVYQDWLVTSYYTDGVTVHDISRPHNMIEVGNYDTSPLQNTNYQGCWGVYPFLPSGLVLGSDMEEGLFVLQPDYKLGSYLEGFTFDASNSQALQGVSVNIVTNNQTVQSNISGEYATGLVGTGDYTVTFQKPFYYPQTHTISLAEGQVTNFNVSLDPIVIFPFEVVVLEQGTNAPILGARVLLQVPLHEVMQSTNGLGESSFILFYEDEYLLTAGKWGYITSCQSLEIDDQTGTITIFLTKGYYDDFVLDFGWSTTSTAQSGDWVREIPIASESGSAPGIDAPMDCGGHAYLTGNGSINPNADQVTNGIVQLISPSFDLTDFTDPHLNYWTWYYNFFGPNPPPNDTLSVSLSNGLETVIIEFKAFPDSPQSEWVFSSIRVLDHITPTENMQLRLQISDFNATVNITEAGFDYFSVSNSNTVGILNNEAHQTAVYPNPSEGKFELRTNSEFESWTVTDLNGRIVKVGSNKLIDLQDLESGVYILQVKLSSGEYFIQRLIKM